MVKRPLVNAAVSLCALLPSYAVAFVAGPASLACTGSVLRNPCINFSGALLAPTAFYRSHRVLVGRHSIRSGRSLRVNSVLALRLSGGAAEMGDRQVCVHLPLLSVQRSAGYEEFKATPRRRGRRMCLEAICNAVATRQKLGSIATGTATRVIPRVVTTREGGPRACRETEAAGKASKWAYRLFQGQWTRAGTLCVRASRLSGCR
jgi:hypothetical protein